MLYEANDKDKQRKTEWTPCLNYSLPIYIGNMEQTLVSTQEVNVNLQILLERAVLSQKKVDTDTMQRVRQFQGDLSKVIKKKKKGQIST